MTFTLVSSKAFRFQTYSLKGTISNIQEVLFDCFLNSMEEIKPKWFPTQEEASVEAGL